MFPRVPIRSFIFKIASRCNLDCSYCYVYNKGDASYLGQPRVMPPLVVDAAIDGIRRYTSGHGIKQVAIALHGGEPLLAGKQFFQKLVYKANRELLPDTRPLFIMQTNGTLLDQEWLDLLRDLGISFGISLDGPQQINDANRVDRRGVGSYVRIRSAIDRVLADSRIGNLFRGLLTVINLDADPVEVYNLYRTIGIRNVDFLLPDGHYDNPPPRLTPGSAEAPYADWLIPLFDAWFTDNDPSFHIRIFEDIISLILGGTQSGDNLGGGGNGIVVIESDGTIEPLDVLKICGDRFTKTDFNVLTSDIENIYRSELVRRYQAGPRALCSTCQECRIRTVCGGGYFPHRYSTTNGFDNPSVYCRDLMKLISHIQKTVAVALPESARSKLCVDL
jgi:uncharacterized protein